MSADTHGAMRCPRCGNTMEPGFVQAGRGLRFRKDGRVHLTVFGGKRLVSVWKSSGSPAWDCATCNLVVMHYAGN